MNKEPICEHCGEYKNCVCTFEKCSKCGVSYSNFDADEKHGIYEYRGFLLCEECHEVGIKAVDYKREQVREVVEATTKSQRAGEFVNNRGKYHSENVAVDGLPIIKIKEPQILKDYEKGIL